MTHPLRASRHFLALLLVLTGACEAGDAPGSGDAGDASGAADGGSAGVDGHAVAAAEPAEVAPALEDALLEDPAFIPFRVTAEGAVEAELEGSLTLAPGNRARLEATGTFAGRAQELLLVSDGERMVLAAGDRRTELPTPPELNTALVVGLTRMGVLHNLARLTGIATPDHADGGAREWVVLEGHRADEEGGVTFDLVVAGERSGSATLFVDGGRPLERRQTVRFPQGEMWGDMRVVESYGDVAMGPGTGIAEDAFRVDADGAGRRGEG